MLGKSINKKDLSISSSIMVFIVVLSLGAVGKANIPLVNNEQNQESLRQTNGEQDLIVPNAYQYSYLYANADRINNNLNKKNPKGYYAKPSADIKSDELGFSYAPKYAKTPR